MQNHTSHNYQQNFQLIFNLGLAFATLLILSLLSSVFLLLIDPVVNDTPLSPSGLSVVIAITGAMLITYSFLLFVTRDYLQSIFPSRFKFTFVGTFISLVLGVAIAYLVHTASSIFPQQSVEQDVFTMVMNHSAAAQYFLITAVVVLAPIFEEYLFRGLIFDSLQTRFVKSVAIFLSAVVFMAFHLLEYYDYWVALLAIFTLGVILALLRIISGSILNSIFCHASYNLSILLLV